MEEALGKTAGIQTVTASEESNYEIVSDIEVLAVNVEKVEK
jgi:hypothetical protein